MINTTSDTIKLEKFILVKPFNGALLRSFGFLYSYLSMCQTSWDQPGLQALEIYNRLYVRTNLNEPKNEPKSLQHKND